MNPLYSTLLADATFHELLLVFDQDIAIAMRRGRKARDDGSLYPRGDRNDRQDREPARAPELAAPQARKEGD